MTPSGIEPATFRLVEQCPRTVAFLIKTVHDVTCVLHKGIFFFGYVLVCTYRVFISTNHVLWEVSVDVKWPPCFVVLLRPEDECAALLRNVHNQSTRRHVPEDLSLHQDSCRCH